jgi:hypothetical protein
MRLADVPYPANEALDLSPVFLLIGEERPHNRIVGFVLVEQIEGLVVSFELQF